MSSSKPEYTQTLVAAAKYGDEDVVKALLASGADPRAENSRALCVAAAGGTPSHLQTVKILLASGADPGVENSEIFRHAAASGRTALVELLLEAAKSDSRINPGALDNWAICVAAKNGHVRTVELLLEAAKSDSRIDPGADSSWALRKAAKGGHVKIVEMLLETKRVDVGINNNEALREAEVGKMPGHAKIAKMLKAAQGKTKDEKETKRDLLGKLKKMMAQLGAMVKSLEGERP